MKEIYFDQIKLNIQQLKSVVRVLFNLIVINRDRRAQSVRLSLEKCLEMNFPEVADPALNSQIQQQLSEIYERAAGHSGSRLAVKIRVLEEGQEEKNFLQAFLQRNQKAKVLEQYTLPIEITKDYSNNGENLQKIVTAQMRRILTHLQSEDSELSLITQQLQFEVEVTLS